MEGWGGGGLRVQGGRDRWGGEGRWGILDWVGVGSGGFRVEWSRTGAGDVYLTQVRFTLGTSHPCCLLAEAWGTNNEDHRGSRRRGPDASEAENGRVEQRRGQRRDQGPRDHQGVAPRRQPPEPSPAPRGNQAPEARGKERCPGRSSLGHTVGSTSSAATSPERACRVGQGTGLKGTDGIFRGEGRHPGAQRPRPADGTHAVGRGHRHPAPPLVQHRRVSGGNRGREGRGSRRFMQRLEGWRQFPTAPVPGAQSAAAPRRVPPGAQQPRRRALATPPRRPEEPHAQSPASPLLVPGPGQKGQKTHQQPRPAGPTQALQRTSQCQ